MKQKMYVEVGNEERCYPIDYFQDRIFDGEDEILLELQKRDFGSGEMWCHAYGENVESGSGECGKSCKDYKPRNNISGRCTYLDNTFIGTGAYFILTKQGLIKNEKGLSNTKD